MCRKKLPTALQVCKEQHMDSASILVECHDQDELGEVGFKTITVLYINKAIEKCRANGLNPSELSELRKLGQAVQLDADGQKAATAAALKILVRPPRLPIPHIDTPAILTHSSHIDTFLCY